MSNIQVKNVEPEIHEAIRERAEAEGKTLSEYVLELIRRDLRKPRRRDWIEFALSLTPVDISNEELLAGRDRDRDEEASRW